MLLIARVAEIFYLGNEDDLARNLFSEMKGNGENVGDYIIQLDFIKQQNNLPISIQVLGCT